MDQLKCPSCGSIDLVGEGRFYVCQYCGGKLERDVTRIAAVVSSAGGLEKLLERADLYWEMGRIDKAKQLYRQALDIDATNEKARSRV